MLLDHKMLERLERLTLATRNRTRGLYPGEHRSSRLGSSVDFADWRQYTEGDDFRRIDYQLYARLDRIFIRLFEAEDELQLRILLDASRSMEFDGKLDAAKRIAAALAYLAACRRDRARVWVVDGEGARPGPWARSRDSAMVMFKWLEDSQPNGSADVAAAIKTISAGGGMPGVTIVISDLLNEGWEDAVRSLGGASEAALIHVLSADEIQPEVVGDFQLVDAELDSRLEVSVSDQVLRAYRERVSAWLAAVQTACRYRRIRYARVDPAVDLESFLLVDLRSHGLVR